MFVSRMLNGIFVCLAAIGSVWCVELGLADDAKAEGTADPAELSRRPNILWIMADQLRYDCVGANGNRIIKTPGLDRLAAESANFSNAFVQAPVCVPSRASFFTGRYPHSHRNRVNYTPLAESEVLLPARLKKAGYRTAIVGKSHLYYHYPPTEEEARLTGFELVDLHDGVSFTDPWSAYARWRQANDPLRDIPYRQLARAVPQLRAKLPPPMGCSRFCGHSEVRPKSRSPGTFAGSVCESLR